MTSGIDAEGVVDLLAGGAIQIQHFETQTGRFDHDLSQRSHCRVVDLAVGRLDVVLAVHLQVCVF